MNCQTRTMTATTASGARLVGLRLVATAVALVAGLALAACTDSTHTKETPSGPDVPRPEGHGELRWQSDIALEDRPSEGRANRGYILLIPMEAHDQWWASLGWGVQPMVEVTYVDGHVASPYGTYQHIHDKVGLDLLDDVAEFGTVSEVSEHGYFPEPTEAGLYWACVADEYAGGLWVAGCDIALLGDHPLVLTEHMGDVTATSENKDYGMERPEGW